ncbi:TPA: ead/Ea22-like family protein [Klebsiella aerogenes]
MTDITELAQTLKSAITEATPGEWYVDYDFDVCTEGCGFIAETHGNNLAHNAQYIALANPQNVLALVEALEKAQAQSSKWLEAYHKAVSIGARYEERIAALTSENAALKGSVENAAGCISAAYAEGLIDVLAESSDERLVDLVNRRLLLAYLPVEAPATDDALVAMGDAVLLEQLEDSRKAIVSQSKIIAALESRAVTIEPFRSFVTDADLAALHRFAECCDDPESGGHDLEKEQVRRLEAIGALQRSGRISYITGFGDFLISITSGIKWEAE